MKIIHRDSKPSSAPVSIILKLGTKINFSFQEIGKWEVRNGREKCGERKKKKGLLGAHGLLSDPSVASSILPSYLETRH